MTREGSSVVPFLYMRGANLDQNLVRRLSRGEIEEILVLLDGVKDALNVQVHDLRKGTVRMCFELLAPSRTRIRKKDIDMIGRRADFSHQPLDLRDLRAVRGNGDGLGTGALLGQGVERGAGFFARFGFAGSDVYFGAAVFEQTVWER